MNENEGVDWHPSLALWKNKIRVSLPKRGGGVRVERTASDSRFLGSGAESVPWSQVVML